MKIVVGTRHWIGPDWFHIDGDATPLIDNEGVLHPVDLVCDARSIPLPDGYAEHLFSSECLEHFPWAEAPKVLKEWGRLVKPGGTIRTEVPDFLAACRQVLETDTEDMDFAIQQIIFGGQANKFDYHYTGITARMLSKWYNEMGFAVDDVKNGWECGWLRVDGTKYEN